MSISIGGASLARLSQIKMFLRAKTPQDLVRKQLDLNLQLKGQASYTDISFVGGFWYAWFLIDIDKYADVVRGLNGS